MLNTPYTQVKVEKSNSPYGNYVVRVSEVTMRFFFRKADAKAFADKFNAKMIAWDGDYSMLPLHLDWI